MNIRVNGLRAGIMATMMAVTGTGCKRAHFVPMPKEKVTPRMEQVIDSFYKEGRKIAENPCFKFNGCDTVMYHEEYSKNPAKLQDYLNWRVYENTHIYDDNGVEYEFNDGSDPHYIISGTQFYTTDSIKPYMTVSKYIKNN